MTNPPSSSGVLPPGTRLAHYEITNLVGAGGMGLVYVARDTKLGRDVALKVLPDDVAADADRRARFEREARLVAAVNHPNIVTIHSVEEADRRLFLTMELVKGRPLSDLIRPGGMPLDALLGLAVPVANAVAAAHAQGITHRDLKPANVMIGNDGVVKVLDFGLAKQHDALAATDLTTTAGLTEDGRILGTVSYMSPEQAQGKAVDTRSDVFSLGTMLFEMATGTRPFKGETAVGTLTAILRDTPPLVSTINPAIPKELARVIHRALAKDPDRRLQSAKDLRNELDDIRQELAAQPAPGSNRRSIAIAGVALVVAAAAGAAWLGRGSVPEPGMTSPSITNVRVAEVTSEDGLEFSPSLSPDGKWVVYTRDDQGTGQTDIFLRAVGGLTAINLTPDSPEDDLQPAFSPDGERIAFRSERDGGGLFIMGRTGDSVRRLTAEGFNPSWSPDGSQIVYGTESIRTNPGGRTRLGATLRIVAISSNEPRPLTTVDAVEPAWSPHGQRIAFWGLTGDLNQRDVWTVAAAGGDPVPVTNDAAVDWCPVWSPDGRFLYFSSNRSGGYGIWRVPIDESSGRPAGEPEAVPIPRPGLMRLSFSADGQSLATASVTFRQRIESVAFDPVKGTVGARRPISVSAEIGTNTGGVSLSRNGLLAFVRETIGGQQDLWVMKADGTGLRQLTNDAARDVRPSWSPDGSQLLFDSDRSGMYQMWTIAADGGGLKQITDYPGMVQLGLWAPDGNRAVASARRARKVLLFDPRVAASGQTLEELPAPTRAELHPASWSRDGLRIAGHTFASDGPTQLVVLSLASRTYDVLPAQGQGPVWLRDERRLLYSTGRELRLFDTRSRTSHGVSSWPRETIGSPELSPDERTLYLSFTQTQGDIVIVTMPRGSS